MKVYVVVFKIRNYADDGRDYNTEIIEVWQNENKAQKRVNQLNYNDGVDVNDKNFNWNCYYTYLTE